MTFDSSEMVSPVRESAPQTPLPTGIRDARCPGVGHFSSSRVDSTSYRDLFEHMLDGFALHQIILDENGAPIDYRFLDVNPAFERMTGLTAAAVIGRTVREVIPGIEPIWIKTYGNVALEITRRVWKNPIEILGRSFEVSAYLPGPGKFACIIKDVSRRREAEAVHRLDEARLGSMIAVSQHPSRDLTGLLDFALDEAIRLNRQQDRLHLYVQWSEAQIHLEYVVTRGDG